MIVAYIITHSVLFLYLVHRFFGLGCRERSCELYALRSVRDGVDGRRRVGVGGRGGWGGCFGVGKFNVREARENPFHGDVFR